MASRNHQREVNFEQRKPVWRATIAAPKTIRSIPMKLARLRRRRNRLRSNLRSRAKL